MSNLRKLSTFRQLSLNCETPNLDNRRKTFKKQFSQDIPDVKNKWSDEIGIKISLNTKDRTGFINPPPIRIAWEEDEPKIKAEDAVIIKKCNEIKRIPVGRISRSGSLEKDSILNSKQDLTERLRQYVRDKEPAQSKPPIMEKEPEKPNLKIFLGSNPKDNNEEFQNHLAQFQEKVPEPPKLIPPLITNTVSNKPFRIRKNVSTKINLKEIAYSPTKINKLNPRTLDSNAIVVVPIFENEEVVPQAPVESTESNFNKNDAAVLESKAIDSIIIRPSTAAASRRQQFQKRTNSAFNSTVKDSIRVPLVRASSAPIKPERGKSKFINSKRKSKPIKKLQMRSFEKEDSTEKPSANGENVKNQKALNRMTAVNGNEVVTMVSLVSPAGSDCEEEIEEKPKIVAKTPAKDDCDIPKHMSLRKAVKTVSFQQSSIHAIRSFSASFPARRASVAAAFMLGNHSRTPTAVHAPKIQEKRATNSNQPDDDERVPKRRVMKSLQDPPDGESIEECVTENETADHGKKHPFSIDIKTKELIEEAGDTDEKNEPDSSVNESQHEEEKVDTKTPKEQQCWNLYCKMMEKGVNVSFDTVLRGMLTPTEYRMSKKNFDQEEVKEETTENLSTTN